MTSQFQRKNQVWSARFSETTSELVRKYTASIFFDQRLALVDIQATLAHANMLASQGIISVDDLKAIKQGMEQIRHEIEGNKFNWDINLEDVHLNIEARLVALIGTAGKRLHTGRSRNDQVATDLRIWLRNEIDNIIYLLNKLRISLIDLAEDYKSTIMPGFTHLQIAQPITFGHHLMAYVEMFSRDIERLCDCRNRVNRLPLGSAALAGTSYSIDRTYVAKELAFKDICRNSVDAVSDRDFAIEFVSSAALIMIHISRFSEELIFWMSPGINFVNISDRFCTGSSIMPQKKNPDVAELARGKVGRVAGHLMALLIIMKAQTLAYNKDNQEDKEPLFDSVDTIVSTLTVFTEMINGISVNTNNMYKAASQGFATATDLADYLVNCGLPFRDAHEAVSKIINICIKHECDLSNLPINEINSTIPEIAKYINKSIIKNLSLENSVLSRKHIGATSPEQITKAIEYARKWCYSIQ